MRNTEPHLTFAKTPEAGAIGEGGTATSPTRGSFEILDRFEDDVVITFTLHRQTS